MTITSTFIFILSYFILTLYSYKQSFSSSYISLQILSILAETYHLSYMIFLSILNILLFQIAQKLTFKGIYGAIHK